MQGCSPLAVHFTNTSGGAGTLTYFWDFGNGNTAVIQNPATVVYSNSGIYHVSLIVSNGNPAQSDTAFMTINAYAHPIASFSTDVHIGCDHLTVQFTDESVSGGATINSWMWAFDDGGGSTQSNPNHTYALPGTYTVFLRVRDVNGCYSDTTITNYVIVSTTPTTSFTADVTNKCIPPLSTNFTGTAQGNGTLNYSWSFGDGGSATTQNALNTYTGSGHYNVSFTATDQYGCTHTTTQNSYINISSSSLPPPTIQFSADITASCDTPLTVNFTNTSQGNAPLSYLWNFGDGTSSIAQNPTNIYHTNGGFNVSLSVTDANGCGDSLFKSSYINISQIHASFTITGGDTACVNESVSFVNTSGSSNSSWYDNTSIISNPYTFTTSGNHIIKMIAEPGTSCADTASKTIYIAALPNANFTISDKYNCKIPDTVGFVSSGTGITAWLWNFGDGNTSTVANISHIYNNVGNFNIIHKVTNIFGCEATKTDTVFVNPPVAHLLNDTNRACVPLPILFEDNSTCNTHFDQFVSWLWTFGDGQPPSNQQDSITHVYTIDGDFWASLTVVTQHGCSAKDSVKISVGSHQNLNFLVDNSATTVIACAQDSVYITNLTTDLTLIDTCFWKFGAVLTSMLNDPLPFVLHNTVDTGFVVFQLVTTYNGCLDTLKKDSAMYIKGPVIKTVSIALNQMHCDHDSCYVYYLTTNTQAAQYWKWDWRDSTSIDSLIADTARHPYQSTGNRLVRVWAFNDSTGCVYRDSLSVKPRDIRANFDSLVWNDTICYTPNGFTASTYKDAVSWKWDFGDGSAQTAWGTAISNHLYDTAGIYSLKMYSRTDNELQCVDSVDKPIRVFKPEIDFYGDTLTGCAQLPLNVHFHSTSFSPGIGLDIFNWTFGDGNTLTGIDSVPFHPYPVAGKYNIILQVTDSFGCVNSLTKTDYIASLAVTANFHPTPLNYCTGAAVTFTSTSTAIPSDYPPLHFHWFFGNGDSSYVASPSYNYLVKGDYVVTLVVSDTLGCYDSLVNITDTIKVQDIVASFTSDTSSTCYPFIPTITNTTLTEYNPIFTWDFGDGTSSTVQNPSHPYTHPGNDTLTLIANTTYGCTDTVSLIIHVGGPYARISIDSSQVCKGDTVVFNITDTISVSTYIWDFGDGNGALNVSPVSHQYTYVPGSGLFHVSMFYNSPTGDCPKTADTLISIYQVIADFTRMQQGSTPSDTSGCTPLSIVCSDLSFGATEWNWNFGDGASSNVQNPAVHPFVNTTQNNQTYNISLIIKNSIGCTDTANLAVVVYPKPDIFISNDTTICRGTSIQIHALGGSSVVWSPSSNLSSTTTPYTNANPINTITYSAQIQSIDGCTNSDNIIITVQQTPQLTTSHDTSIIVGEYVDLSVTSDISSVTYTWIPETDLTCGTCPDPTARPMSSTDYIIRVQDAFGCPYTQDTVSIKVRYEFTVDVPTVFTPNDDGHNETIFVKGWGIKKMNLFKIFNRWGQLVFETDDIKQGWNGVFNGKIQPSDTYTYFVEVELFDGNTLNKKGTFNLLR